MKKMIQMAVIVALISANSGLAETDYLTNDLPIIKQGLANNTDELIAQKLIVNVAKKTLDTLVKNNEITEQEAQSEKAALDAIFANNIKNSSYQELLTYQIKRPFQFVYTKLTDPDASALERFAYGTAVA